MAGKCPLSRTPEGKRRSERNINRKLLSDAAEGHQEELYLRDGNSPSSVKDSADKDQEDDEAVLDEATEEEHGKEEQDSNVVLVDDDDDDDNDDDDDDDDDDIDEGNNMNGLFEEVLENTEDRRYDDYPPNVTAVIKLDTKG